ncbi:hypothetical protein SCHPADRAFT_936671 [Schizopora paradoxa]|uniref:RTA1-domain-containing protein n=1 Tax=Schizopora paradoxa TaxID=27342 RepID=A0A0H2S0E8_9AGAM|nr:hypothetical protein SCHPADRAFT_936671 [Schizopora paradoxa]
MADMERTALQSVYDYEPSTPLAVVSGAVFVTISASLLYRLVLRRDWWGLCLPIGVSAYASGFALRPVVKHHSDSTGLFIAMQLLIITSPATFLAFNYIVYGRFIRNRIGRGYCLFRPTSIAKIFVFSDVLTFMIQGAGGGIETSRSNGKLGTNILLLGLILQIVSYLFFVTLILYTHRTVAKANKVIRYDRAWRTVYLLYFSSLFIVIRGVYRIVEFGQGRLGLLVTHEVFFYTLDTLPLFFATVIYVFQWPGIYTEAQDMANAGRMDSQRDVEKHLERQATDNQYSV